MNETTYSYDNVNFHKTFVPQEIYITKILELAERKFIGSKEEICRITGIPTGKTSGKVVPHILYSWYMGLTAYSLNKGKYMLGLTELGITILKEDKHIFEDITKMICHYNMCDKNDGALVWSFLYHNIEPMYDEVISLDLLKKKCNEFYQQKPEFDVIRKAYSGDGFWASLNVFDFSDGFSIKSSYYNKTMKYVYAYSLLSSWDKYFTEQQEITIDQIVEIIKWNRKFGFDNDEMQYVLEELDAENIIKLNKQLIPYTVIRTTEPNALLPHLYDLLA